MSTSKYVVLESGTLVTDEGKVYVTVEAEEQAVRQCEKFWEAQVMRLRAALDLSAGVLEWIAGLHPDNPRSAEQAASAAFAGGRKAREALESSRAPTTMKAAGSPATGMIPNVPSMPASRGSGLDDMVNQTVSHER